MAAGRATGEVQGRAVVPELSCVVERHACNRDAGDDHPGVQVMRITSVLLIVLALGACGRGAARRPTPPDPAPTAVPAEPAPVVINGHITYPEKVAMAPNVVVTIQVVDVSRADAPAVVVATTELYPEGKQIPLSFRLSAKRSAFAKGRRYQVNVRITEGKVLRFITKQAHPLDIDNLPSRFDIVVNAVAQRLW